MKILEKSSKAREDARSHLALALMMVFTAIAAFLCYAAVYSPDRIHWEGTDKPFPWWFSLLFSSVFLFLGLGTLGWFVWRIVNDYETGSYVDLDFRHFVYWDGPTPAPRKVIDLSAVVSINAVWCFFFDDIDPFRRFGREARRMVVL